MSPVFVRLALRYRGQYKGQAAAIMQVSFVHPLKMEDICAICLESLRIGRKCSLLCGHVYHIFCFEEWAKESNSCPTCRSNRMWYEIFYEKSEPMEID